MNCSTSLSNGSIPSFAAPLDIVCRRFAEDYDGRAMLWGRRPEQTGIDRLLSAAESGTGGALLLTGEAGVGKSALLDYACEQAAAFKVTSVTGIERESDLGYAGLHQLLRPWFGLIGRLRANQANALSGALGLESVAQPDRFLVSAALLDLLAEGEFELLGAAPWAERARAELRATGQTFRRRDPTALETLTPQEFQVARLVAAGGTNGDVAAQLFLSHRTVSYHLHNVYRKLGVASRTELARIEFERGLETSVG